MSGRLRRASFWIYIIQVNNEGAGAEAIIINPKFSGGVEFRRGPKSRKQIVLYTKYDI